MTNEPFGYEGAKSPTSGASDFNAIAFLVRQALAGTNVARLVIVRSCTNDGGVSPVGFVSVQPLVSQLDGSGRAVPHGVINNMPYQRVQGGANAIIIDPQAGDIGLAIFEDRDISSVKANKAESTPGSLRQHDMADGMYLGGLLNGTPAQYVQLNSEGITVFSPTKITLDAPLVEIRTAALNIQDRDGLPADVTASGQFNFVGNQLTHNGVNIGSDHTHEGVEAGDDTTGAPST